MTASHAAGLILAALAAASSFAAIPKLDHLYPAAGQQGTTLTVTASGEFKPWPPRVWVDAPGIEFQPTKVAGKFEIHVVPDAPPGPHLVRLYNEEGASQPRFFIVSTEPELLEKEPNDDYRAPQKISGLPATISGRLDKVGDVDSFAVTLKKGETLSAWIDAYVLASTFDGILRILDERGVPMAFNHDGLTLDPNLTWMAPRDGTFVVQVFGFHYPATQTTDLAGGEGAIYRLHLTTAPQPRFRFPPVPPKNGPEISSKEATQSAPQPIAVPCVVSGCIAKPGEVDRFAFSVEKQKLYSLQVAAALGGSPLDAWLEIENQEGKQLARNDDSEGLPDPQLAWTAPADGTFIAAIGDVTHHGGPDYVYRFTITEAVPSAAGTTASHAVEIVAGKTGEIKVAVKRDNGFKARLQLRARGLPEGCSAPDVDVPEKDGEVPFKITAPANSAAISQPFRVFLRETVSGREYPVSYPMTVTSELNGVPQGYRQLVINSTDQLWLTVTPAPIKTEAAKPAPPP